MSDGLQIITSIIGILAALVTAIRWLMKAYYKQSQDLLRTKKELYAERFERLKDVTDELETSLREAESSLKVELTDTRKLLNKTRLEVEQAKNQMVRYVDSNEKRIKVLENNIIKITDDLIIIKASKPKGN